MDRRCADRHLRAGRRRHRPNRRWHTAAASTKQGVTYTNDIKTILDASCVKCHGVDKPKARLQLNSLEATLKGGKDGKIVTVGDSTNSLIVKAVAHLTADHDSWMPPLNNKAGIKPFTPDQIGLIRAWIDQGAK